MAEYINQAKLLQALRREEQRKRDALQDPFKVKEQDVFQRIVQKLKYSLKTIRPGGE